MRALFLAALLLATTFAGCADDAGSRTDSAGENNFALREDTKSFTLAPRQNIEWKFRLDKGSELDYAWSASRPVSFDFHGDYDDGTDNFVSHKRATLASDKGTFTVPFAGRHGWYFENGNSQTVTITLTTTGAYEVVGRTGGNAP
jgi:hypothetical protein